MAAHSRPDSFVCCSPTPTPQPLDAGAGVLMTPIVRSMVLTVVSVVSMDTLMSMMPTRLPRNNILML